MTCAGCGSSHPAALGMPVDSESYGIPCGCAERLLRATAGGLFGSTMLAEDDRPTVAPPRDADLEAFEADIAEVSETWARVRHVGRVVRETIPGTVAAMRGGAS